MKVDLNPDKEWGFLIDPRTLQVMKITNELPEKFFFVIKIREYLEEIERTVIRNNYGLIKNEKIQKLDKKQLSVLLSAALSRYILKNYDLPKAVKIEKNLKYTKPANFAFFVGNYDVFHLSVDSSDLGGDNPKEIIDKIIQKTNKNLFREKQDTKWKIEYAKSGISKCRKCSNYIERNTLRLGEPSFYQNDLAFHWYHESCINWFKLKTEMIAGLEELKQDDKKRIEQKLGK